MRTMIAIVAAALLVLSIATTPSQAATPQYYQPQPQYPVNSDVQVVTSWYQRYLGREPDAGGLQQWVYQRQIGYNVEAGILGSDEYYTRIGSTPESFIVSLYVNILGRQPRQDEVQTWMNRLQTLGYNREAMAGDFLNAAAYELSIRGGTSAVPPNSYQVVTPPTYNYVVPTYERTYRPLLPLRGFSLRFWR